MPIEGISNAVRLTRAGIIRLGVKKVHPKTGKEYPTEVNYFVCPDEVRKVYGDEPKKLLIMFPVESELEFFPQWYKCYGNGILLCRGDGKEGRYFDFDKTEFSKRDCPCKKLEKGECKPTGIIQFLLPEVTGSINCYQITTSSINSIKDLNSGIKIIRNLAGRISMIPIIMKREETETQYIADKKPHKSKHFTLKLELPFSLAELQKKAQIPPHEVFLLPEPDESQPEDIFPPNGHAPEEVKAELVDTSEDEEPDIADMASGDVDMNEEAEKDFKNIPLILSNGKKKMVTKFEALDYFKKIKEQIGKDSYYRILGIFGYEKSNEIPPETVPEVYTDMIREYNEMVEDGKIEQNRELFK